MKDKVQIIGLDGATFDIIDPFIQEGHLPNLKKLIQSGVKGSLKTTIPPLTPCAWTSFKTGVNPGKHGIYDFSYLDDKYDLRVSHYDSKKCNSLWKILSQSGRKCCVVNVPFTFPPEKVNGVMVSGFMTPGKDNSFTYPKSLKKEVLKKFPNYRFSEDAKYSDREADKEKFMDEIFRLASLRIKLARYLREEYDWDLFMVVFNGTDHIQHWYWKYFDENHPRYDPKGAEKFKGKFLEFYKKMDNVIGEFIEDEPRAHNMIMSDHGFGIFRKRVFLNNWLRENGFLHLKRSPKTLLKRAFYRMGIDPKFFIDIAFKMGLGKLKNKLSFKKTKAVFKNIGFSFNEIDWRRTKAYSFGYYGPIYINAKKNKKSGIVDNEEYEAIRKDISQGIQEIVDPDTNSNIINTTWPKEELYSGRHFKKLPDIVLSLDNFSYTSSSTFAFPSYELFSPPLTKKSGEHRLNGVFILQGPQIRENINIDNATILDLAPTILNIFNEPIPSNMDGSPLTNVFKQ